MWIEPSEPLENELSELPSLFSQGPKPAVVSGVEKGSIGDDLGFEPGDQLLSINGIRPRDLIDYRLLIVEEELSLQIIDNQGKVHLLNIEKDLDDDLGVQFTEALFDGLKQCNNHCPFCFIDQQPPGHRKTLYLKDDDYRLSFLYGSYLTLTNLKDSDWQRIKDQRLSPLFVSVHSTNPRLRTKLLANPKAVLLKDQIKWFDMNNLQMHTQVVVCPGLNDGDALDQTIRELASYGFSDWPAVLSVAVVPVGLTRFRPSEDELHPVDSSCARQVVSQIEKLQQVFQSKIGSRFVWLSDEWYLIAGLPLPSRASYEDFPQQENGVGSIRAFLKAMDEATMNLPKHLEKPRTCSWVVGRLVENVFQPVCQRINAISGIKLHLYGLPSPYWGQDQVVTGLLTGQDLLEGLQGLDLGDELLLPSIMLKEGEQVFLDDMTLQALGKKLDVPIKIVHGAADIVASIIGHSLEIH